jgi:hypothetical protein
MNKLLASLLALAVSALLLTGCGEEVSKAGTANEGDGTGVVVESESPESDAVEGGGTSNEEEAPEIETAKPGQQVTLGDWDVTVTKVVKNADAVLLVEDLYNEKPKGQYVLVTYTAKYNGAERKADVGSDLTWTFSGSDQVVVDSAYATDESDQKMWPSETRPGGTVQDMASFDVKPGAINGGLISVEYYTDMGDIEYVDFQI